MGKKKEKVIYVDDGRTVADMSGVQRGFRLPERSAHTPRPKAKEVWKTYIAAVKMMFTPMLVVIGAILVIYMILSLVFWLM